MFRQFFGLKYNPFGKEVDVSNVYESEDIKELNSRLKYIQTIRGMFLLIGEPGMGKSTALRKFSAELNPGLYKPCYFSLSTVTVMDFYRGLLMSLGEVPSHKKITMFHQIQQAIMSLYYNQKITPVIMLDDFQALSWGSNFAVTLNGRDAPFISELLNNVDQTGPTSYIVSSIIPSGFYNEISSGKLVITIDETTGVGDGYAVDFVKLLINYNQSIFTGHFTGYVYGAENATVRLLGTSTTIQTDDGGKFSFDAIPGLNAVRGSADGYQESYDYGIVLSSETEWEPVLYLSEGTGTPDIDFSKFAATEAWSEASDWATAELQKASDWGLIPDVLMGADMTKPITRAEFAAICVKVYENLGNTKAQPVTKNPFTDCNDPEVLKAFNLGVTNGTSPTTFSPNMLLNREQAATMLTRVYKKVTMEGWTLETDSQFNLNYTKPAAFADDDKISGWAKESVYFMVANNIIKGVGDNKFAPNNITPAEEAMQYANATREQALIIAARMVENLK
jgi:hypothetical protein